MSLKVGHSLVIPFVASTAIDLGPMWSSSRKTAGESSHARPLTMWRSSRAAIAAPPYFFSTATLKIAAVSVAWALGFTFSYPRGGAENGHLGLESGRVFCSCLGVVEEDIAEDDLEMEEDLVSGALARAVPSPYAYVLTLSMPNRMSGFVLSLLRAWVQHN